MFISWIKTNDYIFPIILTLIKDENLEIRMTLINNLSELNKVIEDMSYQADSWRQCLLQHQ